MKIPESQERWAAWEEPLPALRQMELPRLSPEAETSQRKGKPPSPQSEGVVRQLPLSHASSDSGAETVLLSAALTAPPQASLRVFGESHAQTLPPPGRRERGKPASGGRWQSIVARGLSQGCGRPGMWTPLWVSIDSIFGVLAAQAVEVGKYVPSQGQSHISSVSGVWSPGWAPYKPEPERWTQLLSREAAVGQGQDSG